MKKSSPFPMKIKHCWIFLISSILAQEVVDQPTEDATLGDVQLTTDIVQETSAVDPVTTTSTAAQITTTTILHSSAKSTATTTTTLVTTSVKAVESQVVQPPAPDSDFKPSEDTVVKVLQVPNSAPRTNLASPVTQPLSPSAEFVPGELPADTVIEPVSGATDSSGNSPINATQKTESSSSMTAVYAGVGVGIALVAFGGFVIKARQAKKSRDSIFDEEVATTNPRDLSLERFSNPFEHVNNTAQRMERAYRSGSQLRPERKPINVESVAFTVDDMYRSSAAFSERTVATVPIDTLPKSSHPARDSVPLRFVKSPHPLRESTFSYMSEESSGHANQRIIRDSVDSFAFSETKNRDSATSYSFSEQSVRVDSTLWNELRDSRFDSFEAADAALAVAAAASLHASQDSNSASDKYDSMALSELPHLFDAKQ